VTRALTNRQREVLILAANGNTSAHIAHWLGVSVNTVNESLNRAYRALGARDRAQAVAIAMKIGEFGVDDIQLPDAA
jgi:DNA-binding NarL/FixJ family response regulator